MTRGFEQQGDSAQAAGPVKCRARLVVIGNPAIGVVHAEQPRQQKLVRDGRVQVLPRPGPPRGQAGLDPIADRVSQQRVVPTV